MPLQDAICSEFKFEARRIDRRELGKGKGRTLVAWHKLSAESGAQTSNDIPSRRRYGPYLEVTTKSALVRSRIPGVEYVINPYTGCGHGCRYCYAVFMGKYSKQHQQAAWGSFVEVKTNIAEVLRGERGRWRPCSVSAGGTRR